MSGWIRDCSIARSWSSAFRRNSGRRRLKAELQLRPIQLRNRSENLAAPRPPARLAFRRSNAEDVRRTDAQTARRHAMNILLWVLQVLAAFLYTASGVMKVFMFDKISADVRSFAALPRQVWMALGILELVGVVGLIVPAVLHWQPVL